jgi:membrane-associated phospholipid phosphatase
MSPSQLRALSAGGRRRLRALALAAATAFFAVALLVQLGVAIDAEWRVQRVAQAARAGALETPMRTVSLLGTGWVLLPAAALGGLALRRRAALAVSLVAAGVGAAAAANLAKLLAIRQRPNTVMWAYPSAHTFGIVVFVVLLLYVLWALEAPARVRSLALVAGAVLAVAVGLSRLYLNAHWIGDVIGGATGGLAFAVAVVLVLDRRLRAGATARAGAPGLGAVAG